NEAKLAVLTDAFIDVVAGAFEALTELANFPANAARRWRRGQQLVAVETVLVQLVQVDVVDAGAGVDDAIVDDAALEVQHAEQLAGLHRHA
nr:hypothetical protein [Tanacetum cinerariifolium]